MYPHLRAQAAFATILILGLPEPYRKKNQKSVVPSFFICTTGIRLTVRVVTKFLKMGNNSTDKFFENLAHYYWHENDLSNITVALCNASKCFREKFLHFFFPELKIEDISEVSREIWDSNSMGSRVDIHITMKSDEKYIIEIKKGDRNHHFGQYEVAFDVDKSHFGYITNYYCKEGIELGYDVKTWSQFYDVLDKSRDSEPLIRSYLSYLKSVCSIIKYTKPMDLKSLNSIPQFFGTMDEIVAKESRGLHISPLDEKRGAWNYSYKGFRIDGKNNNEWLTNGYFLICYSSNHPVSVGIAGCKKIPVAEIEKAAKNDRFTYSNPPYIDTEWWGYLWYDISDSTLTQLQDAVSVE